VSPLAYEPSEECYKALFGLVPARGIEPRPTDYESVIR